MVASVVSQRETAAKPVPERRQLFMAVDGVSYEAFALAQSRGLFKRLPHVGRMIAP